MHKTAAVLKRFAAIIPDAPFPKALKDLSVEQRMRLAEADPDLAAVMGGTATAALEASVLDGSFPDSYTAPTQEQINAARIAELEAALPFGSLGRYNEAGEYIAGAPGNLSAALELEMLAPERAAALKLAAQPPVAQPGALTADGAAFVNARIASMNAGGSN